MATDTLKRLSAYAVTPRDDAPPEILPWDHADPWGLDGAARQALGLLLDGEKPGDRLFAVADYLLTFTIEGYGGTEFPDAPILNATALALCGYLCHGKHPEADLWRLAGGARLVTAGHTRRAALDDRLLDACVSTVGAAADETGLPQISDLVTMRERMYGRLLDHDNVERLNVPDADYPLHLAKPMDPREVGAAMRARPWQYEAGLVPPRLIDLEEADLACRNIMTLRAHMLVRHQFGEEIDWNLRLFDDKESTVGINTHQVIRNLAEAYSQTGDEKYVEHCARYLTSFVNQNPMPNHRQLVGPWRTLETGNRQANMWPATVKLAGQTDRFDDAIHAMMARSRLEHMRYLTCYCGGANNWYQVECSGMATAALYSPELKLADTFLRLAMRRLKWINSFAYYDDGFQFELTHSYHMFPSSSMFAVVQAARARGVELPADFEALVEKAHEMYVYAVQPNFILPMFNDCNPNPIDPATHLQAASEAFGRDDFLWTATHGEQGSPPEATSHAWKDCGLYVMRNAWSADAQYLHFDGAPWGASHQHEDKLNFMLYSHGRQMIGDPNIYSYSATELTHYFKSSRSHNIVLVDGRGQARRFLPGARLKTQGKNEWVSQAGFDFSSSEYVEGFAPDPYPGRASREEIDTSVRHRRAIFYVKPGYWILSDLITGEPGDHALSQLFHFSPLPTGDRAEPYRAGVLDASAEGIVTGDREFANIAVLPVDRDVTVATYKGETGPARGWFGIIGEVPAWEAEVTANRDLPARMDAVLFPMAKGEAAHPSVERLASSADVTAFRIRGDGIDDTFILKEEAADAVEVDGISFGGRAVVVRRAEELCAMGFGSESVTVDGEVIAL